MQWITSTVLICCVTSVVAVEKAECQIGYPRAQLKRILGNRLPEFMQWMVGQTFSSCDGRQFNHETREYEPTNCGPHGYVYYTWDVQRFLDERPVID